MRRILVFQHVPHEPLGVLHAMLKRAGFRIRYVNFCRDPHACPGLEGYQGLIVLGGPMSANDDERFAHLATETEIIREAIARDMPVLGICLGAQLMARALGARIHRNPVKEIGWYTVEPTTAGREDPLLAAFAGPQRIFQWHGDTFDLPTGAVHLARSADCEHQAFRYGHKAYALQFHLEVDEPLIRRWLTVPTHRRELAALKGQICPERIRAETPELIAGSLALAERSFAAFIALFRLYRGRRRALPSR
jgi:GMP synthase (glutamine-hydrolysing)